jgi:hypothetical protein
MEFVCFCSAQLAKIKTSETNASLRILFAGSLISSHLGQLSPNRIPIRNRHLLVKLYSQRWIEEFRNDVNWGTQEGRIVIVVLECCFIVETLAHREAPLRDHFEWVIDVPDFCEF